MARFNMSKGDPAAEAFLAEVAEVCRKHGVHLEHEDSQGSFIVVRGADESDLDWLLSAYPGESVQAKPE